MKINLKKIVLFIFIIIASGCVSLTIPEFDSSSYGQLEDCLKKKIRNNSLPVVFAVKVEDLNEIYYFKLNESENSYSLYYSATKAGNKSDRTWDEIVNYPKGNMKKELGEQALLKMCIHTVHEWMKSLKKLNKNIRED